MARCDIVIRSQQIHNAGGRPGSHWMGVGLVKISFRHVINCFETFIHVVVYWCARDSANEKASDDIDVSLAWDVADACDASKECPKQLYTLISDADCNQPLFIQFLSQSIIRRNKTLFYVCTTIWVGWTHNQSSNMWNQPCPRTSIPRIKNAGRYKQFKRAWPLICKINDYYFCQWLFQTLMYK